MLMYGKSCLTILVDGLGNFITIINNFRIFLSSDKPSQPGESCNFNLAVQNNELLSSVLRFQILLETIYRKNSKSSFTAHA